MIFVRNGGKLCFATLRDGDGTELQAMFSLDKVGAEALEEWKRRVDLGDLVGVTGEVITSRRGELSVLADSWTMTAKSLRPLPVAHKPLSEETRVRQRYVDLIVRPEARDMVRTRATVVRSLRDSLHKRNYLEVETPMLQLVHGGATARPFVTHSNALDMDLYLRIAPELFLKRAVVGGIERVFEINRNFRNEGVDSVALPGVRDARGLPGICRLQRDGRAPASGFRRPRTPSPAPTWSRTTTEPSWTSAASGDRSPSTACSPRRSARRSPSRPTSHTCAGTPKSTTCPSTRSGDPASSPRSSSRNSWCPLQAPTFVRDYPEETSPLTRATARRPGLTEKWDLYILGFELGTAYSELVDPVVQRERLVVQAQLAAGGDPDAMRLDEDFLRAMEYGMPPSGGMGMGIDRLLMALTGLGIRETILFPLVRPSSSEGSSHPTSPTPVH